MTFKTLVKSWYEEDYQAHYKAFIANLTKYDKPSPFVTRHFYSTDHIYKSVFELKVKELFSYDNAFHLAFRAYYKPGFLGGYFSRRTPTLDRVINRAIEYPRSATAIALYTMIEDRQNSHTPSLQEPMVTKTVSILNGPRK